MPLPLKHVRLPLPNDQVARANYVILGTNSKGSACILEFIVSGYNNDGKYRLLDEDRLHPIPLIPAFGYPLGQDHNDPTEDNPMPRSRSKRIRRT